MKEISDTSMRRAILNAVHLQNFEGWRRFQDLTQLQKTVATYLAYPTWDAVRGRFAVAHGVIALAVPPEWVHLIDEVV